MKRSISMILCFVLLASVLGVFASCKDVAGDVATLDRSAAKEAETEVCETLGNDEKEQLIAKIYDATETVRQEYIGFCSPDWEETEDYVRLFTTLKDAGVTGIVTTSHMLGIDNLGAYLEACCLTDFDAYLNLCRGVGGPDGITAADKISLYEGLLGCIKGIYLHDEPVPEMYEELGNTKNLLRWVLPEAENWQMGTNLYPYQPGVEVLGPTRATYFTTSLTDYIEEIEPDYICYDRYPWESNGNTAADSPAEFVGNNLMVYHAARLYGITPCCYLQTSHVGGYLYPTEAQYALEVNTALACGMDKLYLFMIYPIESKFGGVVDEEGEPTEMYDRVKTVSEEVAAMKGIYKNFTVENIIICNEASYTAVLSETDTSIGSSYLTDSYGVLSSVETAGKALVGCSQGENGQSGLYVVNLDYLSGEDGTYTLHFSEETAYQIWGEGGLEDLGTATDLDLTLGCGRGKFVIVGCDNTAE